MRRNSKNLILGEFREIDGLEGKVIHPTVELLPTGPKIILETSRQERVPRIEWVLNIEVIFRANCSEER